VLPHQSIARIGCDCIGYDCIVRAKRDGGEAHGNVALHIVACEHKLDSQAGQASELSWRGGRNVRLSQWRYSQLHTSV
jgi:hypothetical protein